MADKQNPVYKRIREIGSDYAGEQIVRLGDDSGDETVETGTPGQFYARQHNGKVIKVYNSIGTAPEFDTRVRVVRTRFSPQIWKIAEVLEDYEKPANAGRIAYHHKQHEEMGPDRLSLDRKQIKQLSCRAGGGFNVRVYGATVVSSTGIVIINNETLDLSAYTLTAGARYVSIEADEDGALSLNAGTAFAAPNIGTAADIPSPGSGKVTLYYVLLHEGQTKIIDANIKPIISLPGASIPSSHSHFNDAEGDPADVSISSSSDGTSSFGARRDHVHLYTPSGSEGGGGGGSHEHKLARWNGVETQTDFELPDFADSLTRVELNGLIEDPLVYSLSSDGSKIVLDFALESDQIVSAEYIVRSLLL